MYLVLDFWGGLTEEKEGRSEKLQFVVKHKQRRRIKGRGGGGRATSKETVLQWESALLSAAPCWGLCGIGEHEEDGTSQNQIPLEHSNTVTGHTVRHKHGTEQPDRAGPHRTGPQEPNKINKKSAAYCNSILWPLDRKKRSEFTPK